MAADMVKQVDILIVGAGPSGLMMAAQLLRYGIHPYIIDAKEGPVKESRAIIMQARSLEYFGQMNLANELLAAGQPCHGLTLQTGNQLTGRMPFSDPSTTNTPYPFVHIIPQRETERILLSRLTAQTCPVHWHTQLQSLSQKEQWVDAQIEQQGTIIQLQCKWVIGADGAQSLVRTQCGIRFEGHTYPDKFFRADVSLSRIPNDDIRLFLPKKGFLTVLPLTQDGHYRLIGSLSSKKTDRPLQSYMDIKLLVDHTLGFELPVTSCTSIAGFTLQKRMASTFRSERCFLIGDAAHIHSSAGGQGMDTGLQDAVNLAWKLAYLVNNQANSHLLNSYAGERMSNARSLQNSTDRIFTWVVSRNRLISGLSRWVIPRIFNFIRIRPDRLHNTFRHLAQLTTTYRNSELAVHHAYAGQIKAGDRLPYLPVFDEKTKILTNLHRWCDKPGFILLLLGTLNANSLFIMGQWVRQRFPRIMHLYYLPFSEANIGVFRAFEIKPDATKMLLIRPDMYIGYMNDTIGAALIETYMREIIGWKDNSVNFVP